MFLSHRSCVFTVYSKWNDIISAGLAWAGQGWAGLGWAGPVLAGPAGKAEAQGRKRSVGGPAAGLQLHSAGGECGTAVVLPGELLSCQLMQQSQVSKRLHLHKLCHLSSASGEAIAELRLKPLKCYFA